MAKETMNLTVRVSGSLQEFVAREVSDGDYENVSEYVRGLIRAEKARKEHAEVERTQREVEILRLAAFGEGELLKGRVTDTDEVLDRIEADLDRGVV